MPKEVAFDGAIDGLHLHRNTNVAWITSAHLTNVKKQSFHFALVLTIKYTSKAKVDMNGLIQICVIIGGVGMAAGSVRVS